MIHTYHNSYGIPGRPTECMELTDEIACPDCTDADDECEVCGGQAAIGWATFPYKGSMIPNHPTLRSSTRLVCPCCNGRQEHEWGHGEDTDGGPCSTCRGWGVIRIVKLEG